MKMGGITDW